MSDCSLCGRPAQWKNPINGLWFCDTCKAPDVATKAAAFMGRFVAYPSDATHVAHALWTLHCHLMDAWESTPRIAFLSPEPASGKTRALEVTELLVPNAVEAVNVTPAYLFRKVGDDGAKPTILFDEIDTIFGPRARENEEIRGLLNAGHRRGAVAGRCVVRGKVIETEEIPAYSAVALAGIGDLPDTLLSRCIVVGMKRRSSGEMIEPYRRRVHGPEGEALREEIIEWAASVELGGGLPEMPAGVEDRDADVWEPLLTIADALGGDWPSKARVAAVTLVTESKVSTPSLGIRLLADIRHVMDDEKTMTTESLISGLIALDEAPWGDLRGGPLNPRRLAALLQPYEIRSKTVRIGDNTAKGYTRAELWDAWERYLPSPSIASHPSQTEHAIPEVR